MNIKLTSSKQVSALRIGDTIRRFPSFGDAEQLFDEGRSKDTDVYQIRAINTSNGMLSLVISATPAVLLPTPTDAGRLFIHADNLVSDKRWWVSNK